MKNYYDVNKKDQTKSTLTFDRDITHIIKNNQFIINIKKKTFGFNKYLLEQELNLQHFNLVNEIFHTYRFKEFSFDLKIRIRQATNGKEVKVENMNDFKIVKMYQSFDEWA